jgi:hypothetical protein
MALVCAAQLAELFAAARPAAAQHPWELEFAAAPRQVFAPFEPDFAACA